MIFKRARDWFYIYRQNKALNLSFLKSFKAYNESEKKTTKRFPLILDKNYSEQTIDTPFDRHYIYHPAWAARILKNNKPSLHIDISSTLNFSTVVSAFIPVQFYDFRPAKIELSNFNSSHADLTKLNCSDNSIDSLSCMHTIEHIGLGRYGDPIDYDGDLKAIKELKRVLALNGNLLIVVPIASQEKILFNGNRIYTAEQILNYFSDLELMEFCLIPDNEDDGSLVKNPTKELLSIQKYGCGCFWFRKVK